MQRVRISRSRYLQGGRSNKPITQMSWPSIDTAPYNISNTKYGFIHSSQMFSFISQALWVLLVIYVIETHHKATQNEQIILFIFVCNLSSQIQHTASSVYIYFQFLHFPDVCRHGKDVVSMFAQVMSSLQRNQHGVLAENY